MNRRVIAIVAVVLGIGSVVAHGITSPGFGEDPPLKKRQGKATVDPTAWGSDHVGKPLDSYLTGDECLFCHRKIGPTWGDNRHQLTVRRAEETEAAIRQLQAFGKNGEGKQFARDAQFVMGSDRATRFLKRSRQYGRLEILSASFQPGTAAAKAERRGTSQLKNTNQLHWDAKTFGNRCAGCHATAVNTKDRTFAAISLDCFTCHGDVPLKHTGDIRHALLSSKRRDARQIQSICGQCHLRGGKSKSSGLPYPNTFVAGDNLFRDFQVDLSEDNIRSLPPFERHIYANIRDVATLGKLTTTCLSCHDIHKRSSAKHQQLKSQAICGSCHVPGSDNSILQPAIRSNKSVHSRVCDY